MLKLYKRDGQTTLYWEAWDAGQKSVTVHWGTLGTTGQTKSVAVQRGETAKKVIKRESQQSLADGYAEIDVDDHAQIVVQYRTQDEWGDTGDLDKRHALEDLLNECLGWSGNGHCDGGDIGSGTINAFSFVVDPLLAKDAIVAALRQKNQLDGAVIAVLTPDDDYHVLWPEEFSGEFSV